MSEFVNVPREPTPDMNIAGGIAICEARATAITPVDEADACYRAMLSAAPAPEGVTVDVESGTARTAIVNVVERYVTGWGGEFADNPYDAAPHLARELNAALATREEAPAEAGEIEAARARMFGGMIEVSNYGGLDNPQETFMADLRTLLRAQPPAREDAQPVAWLRSDTLAKLKVAGESIVGIQSLVATHETNHNDVAVYTHPAPDALRVAVEAIIERVKTGAHGSPVQALGALSDIEQIALAALQAEGAN